MKLEYIHEWPCGRGFMFMTAGNVAHLCFKVGLGHGAAGLSDLLRGH